LITHSGFVKTPNHYTRRSACCITGELSIFHESLVLPMLDITNINKASWTEARDVLHFHAEVFSGLRAVVRLS